MHNRGMPISHVTLLKQHGLRVTPIRLRVLSALEQQRHPIGIQELAQTIKDVDLVSVYRTIEAFVESHLVHKHHIGHEHEDYELATRPHHHHVSCTSCGNVEDISICRDPNTIESQALAATHSFHSIQNHEITFHGLCNTCARKRPAR